MKTFSKEADFEAAVIHELTQRGWESEIIKTPTEEDVIKNWAEILFWGSSRCKCFYVWVV